MAQDFYQENIQPYAAIIVKICRAYTYTQSDFEDCYQEICLQLWRSKEGFKGECSWSTWIYKVALNVCLTYVRKDAKSPDLANEDAGLEIQPQSNKDETT